MKMNIHIEDFNWWFWVIGLMFIIISLAGWDPAYYIVMEVYFLNLLNNLLKEKKLLPLYVQVRLVYLAISLNGFWIAGRFYIFLILLVFTFMVAFTDKCMVRSFLKLMPWNRHQEPQLN